MTRRFLTEDPTLDVSRGIGPSPIGRRWIGPRAGVGRPSNRRTWSPGPYPATDAERWAHFRMSVRRTVAALALAGAALALVLTAVYLMTS